MIGKVTFDQHTHLISSNTSFDDLLKIVRKVFEKLPHQFKITVLDQGKYEHNITNDHDIKSFSSLIKDSEQLLTLKVVPIEDEISSDDDFYLLQENEVETEQKLKPQASEQKANEIKTIDQIIEEKVHAKTKELQTKFQNKIAALFFQYQNRFKNWLPQKTDQRLQEFNDPLWNEQKPMGFDFNLKENDEISNRNLQKEFIKHSILSDICESPEDLIQQQPFFDFPVSNKEELLLESEQIQKEEQENQRKQRQQYFYVHCRLCFRSLIKKNFFQCQICPNSFFCSFCKKNQLNCHQVKQTSYSALFSGKRSHKKLKQPIDFKMIEEQDRYKPQKIARKEGQTQEERLLNIAYELSEHYKIFCKLDILRLVRKNPCLEIHQLKYKIDQILLSKPKTLDFKRNKRQM